MIHWAWLVLAFVAGAAFGFLGLIRLIEFIAELGELPFDAARVAADHPDGEERHAPEAQGREAGFESMLEAQIEANQRRATGEPGRAGEGKL
jgi:hypothetical protein